MSCINIDIRVMTTPPVLSIERIGGISVSTLLASEPIIMSLWDRTIHPKVRCNIVCSVGVDRNREIFMVKEGVFLLFDGSTFKVLKDGI